MSETTSTPTPGADDDAAWAGRVDFPRGPGDLRSVTTCPACHALLRSAACTVCGLDLRHPDAAELAALSAQTADLLDARRALIGRLRRDAALASRAPAAPAPLVAPTLAPAPAPAPAAAQAAPMLAGAPAAPAAHVPAAPTAPHRRRPRLRRPRHRRRARVARVARASRSVCSSSASACWRSSRSSGSRTPSSSTAPPCACSSSRAARSRPSPPLPCSRAADSPPQRRASPYSARSSWRSTRGLCGRTIPPGSARSRARLYWGVALLIIAAVAVAWSRLGNLSSPAVGAALVLPLGAALVAGHIADASGLDVDAVAVVAGLAAVLIALAHPVIAPPDRPGLGGVVAVSMLAAAAPGAVLALAAGIGGSLGESGAGGLPAITGAGLALVSAAHAVRAPRLPGAPFVATVIALAAAAGGTLALLAGIVSSVLQSGSTPLTAAGALLAVVTIAVLLSLVPALAERSLDAARVGALLSSAMVAGSAAVVTFLLTLRPLLDSASAVASPLADAASPVQSAADTDLAVLGGALATLGLIALGGRLGGPLRPVVPSTLPALALLLVAATPLAGPWWLVLTIAALLSIGAAAGIARARALEPAPARSAILLALSILAVGGALAALVVAPRLEAAWILGTGTALVAIALGRRAAPSGAATVAALGAAVLLVLAAAPALVDDLARAGVSTSEAGILLTLSALLIAGAQLGRLDAAEQKVAALLAAVVGVIAAVLLADSDPDARVAIADGIAVVLALTALSLVIVRCRRAELRLPASVLMGPSAVLLVIVGLRGVAASSDAVETVAGVALWGPIAALGALLLVSAIALAALGRATTGMRSAGDDRSTRTAVDIGTVAIGLGMLGLAIDRDAAVIGLLVSAIVVLVIALSGDGLIGATSRRRYLGWIALALGTASLWTGLADEEVADPEGYALPLAGALLLIAAALARQDAARGTRSRSTAPLIGAALAIALLPIAVLSGIGAGSPTIRSVVIGVAALALMAAAVGRTEQLERSIPGLPVVLAGVSLTAVGVVTGAVVTDLIATQATPLDEQLRGLLLVVVLAGAASAVRVAAGSALRDPVAGILLGIAALAAGVLGLADVVAPVELVALPVALAALAIGVLELDRRPGTGSWPLLAPGIALLLGPSLIAITVEPEPWRIVALGVVSAGVMLGGLQQRLQAPFVLGGSVLLVHALVQSWPLLSRAAAAVDWWIWLGIVGIIVVAVAARYERRVQNLTAVARRIADLR